MTAPKWGRCSCNPVEHPCAKLAPERTLKEIASKLADDLGLHTGPHEDNPWQLRVILAALREAVGDSPELFECK